MFKKSRRKIVASIMAVLVFLWAATLCTIYGSSYLEVSRRNREMLARHAELYLLPGQDNVLPKEAVPKEVPAGPEPGREGGRPGSDIPRFEDTPAFQLSTFSSVAVSDSGEILSVTNPKISVHEDGELEAMALSVINGRKQTGVKDNLIYHKADKGGYTLVAFMDNTIMQESMTTLFRYTLIFGALTILALFFLAVYLARRIVAPLEESYRKQRQFISDAGHELKTPVSVVNTNAELLFREIGENPWLSNIRYENRRMEALIGQLLDLARTEHAVPVMEPVDLSRLTAGEALPFEALMFEQGLGFSCEIADGLYVYGSSTQLKQIVAILLDNALCHCTPEKDVILSLKKEGRSLSILSVGNDGAPIPPSEREQLFERFYRRDPARTGGAGHYGLGLAIAKAIVSAHRGKISVDCRDGRVIFTVSLPLLRPPQNETDSSK